SSAERLIVPSGRAGVTRAHYVGPAALSTVLCSCRGMHAATARDADWRRPMRARGMCLLAVALVSVTACDRRRTDDLGTESQMQRQAQERADEADRAAEQERAELARKAEEAKKEA